MKKFGLIIKFSKKKKLQCAYLKNLNLFSRSHV